ncbi:CaiB/BaiF CoA transferase family protein [Mycobacterium kyogaense]|uniref:CaiB/BaiF CoA transferase family protein n=1 Tax=Mycobacterium kyogaense TaxID=2212479 RepID=UPI0013C5360E|nr:CaiB/BaiF CoA-transferase family protein [Mycobacterium kyogaense]
MTTTPLRGRTVVDFSLYVPGPHCTKILAELGADVVKVEPLGGDPVRRFMPGLYEGLNSAKRVLAIDVKDPRGLDVCRRLLNGVDVVVEGFRPGVMDRLGIGFADVSALSPAVVYCSLTGYGQEGPRAADAGHDVNYTAVAGGFAVQLAVDDDPQQGPFAAADLGGALYAATAICATLAGIPSQPVHLDVSLSEASLALSAVGWGRAMQGEPIRPDDVGSLAPGYGIYRCRDGRRVAVAAVEDEFWDRLCNALGVEDLTGAPFNDHHGRMTHRRMLTERLRQTIVQWDCATLVDRAHTDGIPVSALHTVDDVRLDAHLRHRDAIRARSRGFEVAHPVQYGGQRPKQQDRPTGTQLTRHDVAMMTGLGDEDIEALARAGVIGQPTTPADA